MCLNYEVRVLCCEPRAGCPASGTRPVTSTTAPPTASPSAVPPVPPSVPPCYCSVSHKLYPAGSIIYQKADLAGHCYYSVCSLDCHVVRQTDHACPTSTPPVTLATLHTGSSPSTPVPVTVPGCPSAVPPRATGETWPMPNCSQATCEGNNVISLRPLPCPEVSPPACANGYPALKVPDEDGCCHHYQCQCVCSGWGDPHYITFDGTYYTFLDNCTYVLVQQIVPVYGHFRVLIDNYFCDAEDGLSCPQSIIVEYRQERVVLTRKPVRGVMTNEIIFNNEVVSPGFRRGGLVVSQVGIRMFVSIPEIGVQVMFTGLIFSVEVPFSKFANNTEGQCGTCTNDPKDECRLPGGAVVTSCSDMSGYWKVTNPDQPSCHGPPRTRPTVGPTTPPAPCPPSPICDLILSDVFQPCHAVIPPRPYYLGCGFDHCHMTHADVVCSGLELYASLCATHGVCIDWRGRTNHTCPFTCPEDKVYQACGPSNPSYCYGGDSASLVALQDAGPTTEGCFCPEGMTLFSESSTVCVPAGCPRCLGPHGEPVEPGHTVSSDCQECTCEPETWTMSCRSQPCPPPPVCPEPGLVPVPMSAQAGQCCPQYTCVCNSSHCPALPACPEGTRQVLTREEGACCPRQQCIWTACRVNGTLHQVSTLELSACRAEREGGAGEMACQGPPRRPAAGDRQTQGPLRWRSLDGHSPAGALQPGETWSEPGNRCVTHECERQQDGPVVVTTRKACPPLSCPADQARLSQDGCCLACPPPQPQNRSTCAVQHRLQVIRLQGCSSSGPVRLAYCQGNCGDTASVYSLEAQALEHSCRCCQELRAAPRNVTLRCPDGSRRAFSYTQVEECGCVGQRCDARGGLGPEEPAPLQRRDPARGRWSRGAPALPLAEGRLPAH
ncbi:mucin-5AC [Pipistrellus kuhlii]|uniref:mucin-5AC n=1 Tax=Pipistrellus kuhlii TaxID=59472 RepID=UPI00174F4669|nr:mucin-5AC [Pipistrellus kuhlii]